MSCLWKNLLAAVAVVALAGGSEAFAVPAGQISEVFFNPPDSEASREYFEVNITTLDPGYTYWFVALECENGGMTANPGDVDLRFQVDSTSGYTYYNPSGTHCSGTSDGTYVTELEGSGASYLFIAVKTTADTPTDMDANWDSDENGSFDSDVATLISSGDWVILDSVAVIGETGENIGAVLYGKSGTVCFAPAAFGASTNPICPAGAVKVDTSATFVGGEFSEIEYVGRVGGVGGAWFAANLSDDDWLGSPNPYASCSYGVGDGGSQACANAECKSQSGTRPYGFPKIITNTYRAPNNPATTCQ